MPGDIFERFSIFQDFTPAQLQLLRPMFVPCEHNTGSLLFEQGEPAVYLYLVLSGEVTIRYKPDDGPPITVSRVRSCGVVGWSAILGNRLYTSGAICSDFTQMLRVNGRDIRNLCEEHPDTGILLLERLAWVIAERLHNTHEQVIELLKQGMRVGLPSIKEA